MGKLGRVEAFAGTLGVVDTQPEMTNRIIRSTRSGSPGAVTLGFRFDPCPKTGKTKNKQPGLERGFSFTLLFDSKRRESAWTFPNGTRLAYVDLHHRPRNE